MISQRACEGCVYNQGIIDNGSLGLMIVCGYFENVIYVHPKVKCSHSSQEQHLEIIHNKVTGDSAVSGDLDLGTAISILSSEKMHRKG